ncbi:hypothetical protein, partial [Campylobacter sp. JMF_08 NE1]|uniref:hypothetical protein n=1 Tax=Campylobacter sp. JMF_08 NE1 TaxID=2983821 RepID=UPI0022E9EC93
MNKVYKLKRSSRGVKVVSEIAKGHSGEKTVREGFGSTIFSSIGKIASAPALGRLAMSLATIVAISAPFAPEGLYAEIVEGTSTGTDTIAIGKDSYVRANNGIAVGTDAKAGHKVTEMYIQASFINDNNPTKVMVKAYTTTQLAEMGITGATKTYYYAYYKKGNSEIKVGGLDRDKDLYKNKDINGELKSELLRAYAFRSDENYEQDDNNYRKSWVAKDSTKTDADVAANVAQFIYNNRNSFEKEIGDPNRFFSDKVVIAGSDGTQIAIGPNSYAMDKGAVALGNSATANGDYTIAIGEEAMAATMNDWSGGNVAIGGKAKAVEMNSEDENDRPGQSTAVGYSAFATGGQAMALGANTIASGYGSISIGGDDIGGTKSDFKLGKIGEYLYVIGGEEHATDHIKILQGIFNGDLVVVGKKIQVNTNKTVAEQEAIRAKYGSSGSNVIDKPSEGNLYIPTTASGLGSMAVGQSSLASNTFSNAFGYMDIAKGIGASAIGTYNVVDGHGSTAVGAENTIVDVNSTAIGVINTIDGGSTNAMALGNGNIVAGSNFSIAAGYYNENHADNTITVGLYNDANKTNAAAVGLNNYALGIGSIAVGGENNATGAYSTAFGLRNQADKDNTLAIGTLNNAEAENSMALGADNNTTKRYSVAAGMSNLAEGEKSAALGFGNTASADRSFSVGMDNNVTETGVESIAHGYGNIVKGKNSIAMGTGNTVTGDRSGVFGDPSVINSNDSYSVGNNNNIAAGNNSVFILGNNVTDTFANSVFLGDSSAYVVAGNTTGGMDTVNEADVKGVIYDGFAGNTPVGVVSIGKEGSARRIQNVAAGLISEDSTDAINGSQLFAVLPKYNVAGANDTVSSVEIGDQTYKFQNLKQGTNIRIDPDGTINAENNPNPTTTLKSDNRVVRISTDEIQSPLLHINGVADAAEESAKANGTNAIAMGNGATTSEKLSIAKAKTKAYNARVDTIKEDDNLNYDTRIINANNYDNMIAALTAIADANKAQADQTQKDRYKAATDQMTNLLHDYSFARATSNNAIAIGTNSEAAGNSSIAMGEGAIARGAATYTYTDKSGKEEKLTSSAIAIGKNARALTRWRNQTTGADETSETTGAIAIGENAWALTPYAITIGSGKGGNQGLGGRDYALDTADKGGFSVTIGYKASTFLYGVKAPGTYYYANTKNSTAIGTAAHTHAANALAIGFSTDATGERSFALGTGSTSLPTGQNHSGSRAGGQGSIVIGDQATAFRYAKEEFVSGDFERSEAGADINVNDAVAIGTGSFVKSQNSVALGGGISYTYHLGTNDNSVNIETKYYAGDDKKWQKEAEGIGAEVGIGATGAVAIGGASADISGADNTYYPTLDENNLTITNYTSAAKVAQNAARAVAIGSGSNANVKNGVALGSYSLANRDNESNVATKIFKGYDMQTNTKGAANTATPDDSTWIATANAIAVGDVSKDITRQITGLAAGSEDTDAVNVAQLKRAGWTLTANDENATLINPGDIANFKNGKNITITADSEGNITVATIDNPNFNSVQFGDNGPKISSDGNGNIKVSDEGGNPVKITNVANGTDDNDAVNVSQLKAAKTEVKGKDGVKVTSEPATDGHTIYTASALVDNKTVQLDSAGNIAAKTTNITTNSNTGKVENPTNTDSLATAGDIVNAINASGWTLKANDENATLINPGDIANFKNGKNITITADSEGNITV